MLMKRTIPFALIIGVITFAGFAATSAQSPADDSASQRLVALQTVSGVIVSVDLPNDTFVLKTNESESLTLSVNDATSYTVDGLKSSKEATLTANAKVTVSHIDNVAMLVAATLASN